MESVHLAEDVQAEESTRRAMIGSAMQGMQRFKQSWYSVMVLKAGIGLGQVTTLTVLLIISNYIPSPLAPFAKQTKPSPTCPKPELFQAWMITQMFRLVGCWSVSVWMTWRSEIRRRRIAEIRAEMERGNGRSERVDDVPPRSDTRTPLVEQSLASHEVVSVNTTPITMPISHSSNSLTSSTSSGSSNSTPEVLSTPCMTPSTSLSGEGFHYHATLGDDGFEELVYCDAEVSPERHDQVEIIKDEQGLCVEESDECVSCHQSETGRRSRVGDNRSSRAARSFLENGTLESENETIELPPAKGLAGFIDRAAPFMSKGFGALSGALFLLGNILAFYPSPAKQDTCYQSAPLLWWGVMAVLAVGWILIAQVFVVVVIVGIGGQAVLAVLRKIGVVAPPPEPIPLRPAQAEPLQQFEIDQIPIVCYVPKPGCPTAPDPSDSSSTFDSPNSTPQSTRPSTARTLSNTPRTLVEVELELEGQVDESRLPIEPLYLEGHQSTCGICQENYRRPREQRAIMLKVERLRLLGCGHAFHVECIDKWLLTGHGNCPFCHRSVKGTMKGVHSTEAEVARSSSRWRLFARAR